MEVDGQIRSPVAGLRWCGCCTLLLHSVGRLTIQCQFHGMASFGSWVLPRLLIVARSGPGIDRPGPLSKMVKLSGVGGAEQCECCRSHVPPASKPWALMGVFRCFSRSDGTETEQTAHGWQESYRDGHERSHVPRSGLQLTPPVSREKGIIVERGGSADAADHLRRRARCQRRDCPDSRSGSRLATHAPVWFRSPNLHYTAGNPLCGMHGDAFLGSSQPERRRVAFKASEVRGKNGTCTPACVRWPLMLLLSLVGLAAGIK